MAGVLSVVWCCCDGGRDSDDDVWWQNGAGMFVKVNDGGVLSGYCASAGVFRI